jgi:hypothetical protein
MLTQNELEAIRTMFDSQVPFVYMPCGCIGIKLHGDHYLSIVNCDSSYDHQPLEIRIREHNPVTSDRERDMDEGHRAKPFTPVSKEKFIEIINELQTLIQCGRAYQELQWRMRALVREDKPHAE